MVSVEFYKIETETIICLWAGSFVDYLNGSSKNHYIFFFLNSSKVLSNLFKSTVITQ